jgi:HD superfamily phosphohydrolase
VHCGVNYGKGIDVERLLDSLYVSEDKKSLTVTEKGRSYLLSILATRNIMYQEVYWHKTVRACESMFKRFFYEYVRIISEGDKIDILNKLNHILNFSDDEFIATLFNWAKIYGNKKLKEMIQPFAYGGRDMIYKPAYIYFDNSSKDPNPTNKFFKKLFKCKYKEIVEKSERFAGLLKKYIPEIEPLDVIFEKTPIDEGERYPLSEFRIYNTRKERYDNHPSEIDSLNDYLTHNKQAYIFCHPSYYEKIRELAINGVLHDILALV